MNVNIISREYYAGSEIEQGFWQFEISESDAQIVIQNNASLALDTATGIKNVSSEIYAGTDPDFLFGGVWAVYQRGDDDKWFIFMVIDEGNPFFTPVPDIESITAIYVEGDYSLHFQAVKNFVEPIVQQITDTFEADFTIDASDWLLVSPLSGNGLVTLTIVPKPTSEMDVGEYTGFVKVMDGIDVMQNIVVTYSLSDFIQSPYLDLENAFTLDTKYITFASQNTGTYFQTNAIVRTYEFFTNTLRLFQVPQKVIPFNGFAKINFSRTIHQLMRRFPEVNIEEMQYRKAEFQLSCEERNLSDNTLIRSITSDTIKFVAGLSYGISDLGFLDFNTKANRVTTKGFAYLNVLVPDGEFEIKVFKNSIETPVETIELSASDGKIISKKVLFENYYQGDVIRYVLDSVSEPMEDPPTKMFIVFPEGKYSKIIVWENEFLLQSAIELTGNYLGKSELEFQSQKLYEKFVEVIENLSSTKEVKFNINTGWLLQTDTDTIESLLRSRRVWLINGSQNINLRPLKSAITFVDSEKDLIDFNLEFQINRTYDEETYSF